MNKFNGIVVVTTAISVINLAKLFVVAGCDKVDQTKNHKPCYIVDLGRSWINRVQSWQKCDDLVWNTNCHLKPFEARLGGISKKDHGVLLFLYLKVTNLMVGCDDHILPRIMSL